MALINKAVSTDTAEGPTTQEQRIVELEQFRGQLALENQILKKTLQRLESRSATRWFVRHINSFSDAEQNLTTFIEKVYNEKRLHSSLGYLPPAEFEAAYTHVAGS